MNSDGFVHLTVDHLGTLRVYENPRELNAKKGPTEVQVYIQMTQAQMRILQRAAQVAKGRVVEATHTVAKENGNGHLGPSSKEAFDRYMQGKDPDPRD